jgi:LCP family protein required for cell wall assembly
MSKSNVVENEQNIEKNEAGETPVKFRLIRELIAEGKASYAKNKKIWIGITLAFFLIFFTPWRINILILGIDQAPNGTAQGRTDTMILTSIPPILPNMHMLSIPRDLYVDIPDVGLQRINTAHYFAEINKAGSGPRAAAITVARNFHVMRPLTVRLSVTGFREIVDAMNGVDIYLPTPMSGMDAGWHHLDDGSALYFVRDRSGSDDFMRQQRQHIFIKGVVRWMINPLKWHLIPSVIKACFSAVDSNVPVFYYPRIVYSLLFSTIRSVDMQSLDRATMVTPYTTEGGGSVLLPNWDAINPLIRMYYK